MAFAKLIVALGHEIYGNVLGVLSPEELATLSPEKAQIRQEVITYRRGIQFIEAFLEQFFKGLPPKIQRDLRTLLAEEERQLKQWSEANTQGQVVRSCDLALQNSKKK